MQSFGILPTGSRVTAVDPDGHWVSYETQQGIKRLRFQPAAAFTFRPPRAPAATNDAEAGVRSWDGKIEVLEGRNRAVGVANYGDLVAEFLGGVPNAPDWLDYDYREITQDAPVIPIKGLLKA